MSEKVSGNFRPLSASELVARVAELQKLLLESERRDVAGDAKVKRLEAEVEKLREMLARVKSKTALDVVAENMEAQAAKRKAEADRDRLAEALREAVADLEWVDMKHDYKFGVAARAALEGRE